MTRTISGHPDQALARSCAKNDNDRMCLAALAWSIHPRWRLVLLGNRDEFHARPTSALAPWPDTPHGMVAGRDLRSGGTWIGIDARGRAAVVTNFRDPLLSQEGPSRGQLIAGYLAGEDCAAAKAATIAGVAGSYAPFNLLLVDPDDCMYVGNHPVARRRLAAGVHAMSNGPLDAPWPKSRNLAGALQAWLDTGDDDLGPLWAALADRQQAADDTLPDTGIGPERERWLSSAFITSAQYGTRASTVLAIDHDNRGFIVERRFGAQGVFTGETRFQIG